MNKLINVLFLFLFHLNAVSTINLKWIVEVKHGGSKTAFKIAKKYNLKVKGMVRILFRLINAIAKHIRLQQLCDDYLYKNVD